MIWILSWLTRSWSHCGRGKVVAQDTFRFSDQQTLMFGIAFILHILQKSLQVLGNIRILILRINIHSLVLHLKQSQHLERIKDMGWNVKHTRRRSDFSIIFGQLLAYTLYGKVQVFLPLSLVLGRSSHNTIHMIEFVVVYSEKVMLSNRMPFWHAQRPLPELP